MNDVPLMADMPQENGPRQLERTAETRTILPRTLVGLSVNGSRSMEYQPEHRR